MKRRRPDPEPQGDVPLTITLLFILEHDIHVFLHIVKQSRSNFGVPAYGLFDIVDPQLSKTRLSEPSIIQIEFQGQ